ncbi:hypothetical protein Krac_10943 [Ktedonobacter racemifer DSM 44963]|uniref:Uncharacterized protein n=1 Tax=Ktedonobacter racemifer DSM 44963 TaxID=485913 RepID=D6TIY3_KTERA|nr:hypothetical protein Krac_10943 [Ktedonobacter racemifer DSM 44963]
MPKQSSQQNTRHQAGNMLSYPFQEQAGITYIKSISKKLFSVHRNARMYYP